MTGGNTGVILDVGRRSTLLTRAPSLGQLAKAPWRRPLGVPLVSREPTVARHFTGSISQHLRNSSVPAALPISTLEDDTIAAVVTGEIQGAVSIIRLSGSRALQVASRVFRPASKGTWIPESHRVYYGRAYDKNGNILDEVLALVMLSPRSYTAEDVVEIHAHGGGVCARRILTACLEAGASLAKPGEFTLRAFLNGRLDLTQAESVEQLINARTAAAADSAMAGLQGGIGAAVNRHRNDCITILAELEARLDFADEEFAPLEQQELHRRLSKLKNDVEATNRTALKGQLVRNGLQVALVGRPNVGKSSLLNACSGTDRAIVTDIPGTTRDVVDVTINMSGVPVTLLDTAGLREASDAVELLGMQRSRATALAADIVVMVIDSSDGWTPEDQELCMSLWGKPSRDGLKLPGVSAPSLLLLNKTDIAGVNTTGIVEKIPEQLLKCFRRVIETSTITENGVDELIAGLLDVAGLSEFAEGTSSWAVNSRQAEALTRAEEALGNVDQSISNGLPVDFWCIDLRSAAFALGEVTGDELAEEVLDTVFSKFCIGK